MEKGHKLWDYMAKRLRIAERNQNASNESKNIFQRDHSSRSVRESLERHTRMPVLEALWLVKGSLRCSEVEQVVSQIEVEWCQVRMSSLDRARSRIRCLEASL